MDELGHLSDERLNEYLDGVLSSRALSQADEHLRDCVTCTRRLDEIAELFVTLDGLPEIHLRKDLAPQIVETLRSRSTVPSASTWKSTWRLGLALAGEAAGALILLGLAWPEALAWLAQGAAPDLTSPFISALDESARLFSVMFAAPDPLGLEALLSSLSTPSIPWASVSSLISVLAGSAFVWLLGNGLLLRVGPPSANRRDR